MARQRRRPPVSYSRAEIATVACPVCQAEPGEPCRGYYGQVRQQNHLDRWWARYWKSYPRAA